MNRGLGATFGRTHGSCPPCNTEIARTSHSTTWQSLHHGRNPSRNPNRISLHNPRERFLYPRVSFNSQCNDSDGVNFCDCQSGRGNIDGCMYYGRNSEPLAFSLENKPVAAQNQCPLFITLPKEIRDMIYELAFMDCTSNPPNSDNRLRRDSQHIKGSLPPSDIAVHLLQTCRAVYLEAYKLPFLLNPLIVYSWGSFPSYDITRPRFVKLAPWQFALIQRVDISLQQASLEDGKLANYLKIWRAKERHEGAVIAPRFYQESRSTYPGTIIQSFNFGVLPNKTPREDGAEVSLQNKTTFYSRDRTSYPISSTARVMVARPLTHLTLRLSRTDWWTWTDHPGTRDESQQLGLDPAYGSGSHLVGRRPTASLMLGLATQRRAGQFPNPNNLSPPPTHFTSTWGAEIAKLPDLKTLELVLETFADKKKQLEAVIDCAKTWRFPLDGVQCELVWDGKMEEKNYKGECTSPGFSEEDEDDEDESDDDGGAPDEHYQERDTESLEDEMEENWLRKCNNFEVRIIRFRRRRI